MSIHPKASQEQSRKFRLYEENILIQDWKDKILLEMGAVEDAYTLVTTRSDGYIYQFEEGAGAEGYKIKFIGSYDKTVKYEQDFNPGL